MASLLRSLLLAAAGYGALVGAAFLSQSRLLYFPDLPSRDLQATPRQAGLAYEDVSLRTADGIRLHGWFVPRPRPRATVLFFHGNAGNISHRLDSIALFAELGLATFILDYRGYGRSEGSPSEAGTYRDAEAAWRHLTAERGLAPEEIVVFGRSLGGAVAAWLAARHPPRALILESTFTSVPDLAEELYPFLPARLLSRFRYDTRAELARVRCPVLVVHSRDDEIVPFRHATALHAAAADARGLIELRGGHNDGFVRSQDGYVADLERFLAGVGLAGDGPS